MGTSLKKINTALTILIGVLIIGGAYLYAEKDVDPTKCVGCNVILISLDTFGAKHSTVYTPELNTTPLLDKRVTKGSFVFESAYTQSSWTLPSHTSMLTGEYPWDLRIWLPENGLPRSTKSIATTLKEYGYHTAAFSNGAFVRPEWGFGNGFDEFYGHTEEEYWEDLPGLFDDATNWLQKNSRGEKPFFLFLRPFEVHDPYVSKNPSVPSFNFKEIISLNLKDGGPSIQDADETRRAYQEEIRETDKYLDNFLNTLSHSRFGRNTIVFVTSDHGEEFREHGNIGVHGHALYRELIHVPLIIFMPEQRAEKRIGSSVEIRSIPSTLTELVGITSKELPGDSLLPLMRGQESDTIALSKTFGTPAMFRQKVRELTSRSTLYEKRKEMLTVDDNALFSGPNQFSAIKGAWHVIRRENGNIEVYNMNEDPDEQNNLAFKVWSLKPEDKKIVDSLIETIATQ